MIMWLYSMYTWLCTITFVVGLFFFLYKEITLGICKSTAKLNGKVVVVTGGNGGIGFETALDLARRGARVILGCRSKDRGSIAVKKIIAETGNKDVEMISLDLGRFESVREFCKILKNTVDKVDILVNNAGIPPQRNGVKLSQDKYDLVLQTNHFSHFLLTVLLKETLKNSDAPRIINVSSMASIQPSPIDYAQIKKGKDYEVDLVYQVSKFMNALFTKELVRRWSSQGFQSYSLHPGFVRTEIFQNMESPPWYKKLPPFLQTILGKMLLVFSYIYGKTAKQGAQTSIYCCVENGLVNGEYYQDCRLAPWWWKNSELDNEDWSRQLWEFSEKLVN